MNTRSQPSIAIIGAGMIGLSCAWELARRGARVTVYEKNWPPRGASWAAAGMLAPAYEAAAEEGAHPKLFDLCMESADLWPDFAAELETASGTPVGYHSGPTTAAALNPDQARRIETLAASLGERGVPHKRWSKTDLATWRSRYGSRTIDGLTLPTDGWTDPRATLEALIKASERAGVSFKHQAYENSPRTPDYDACLDAAGANAVLPGITSIAGVMLVYSAAALRLNSVIRIGAEYAVPRGEITLFGATVGDVPDAVERLRGKALAAFPQLEGYAPIAHWRGARPALSDHAPALGETGEKSFIAAGHYRNGILLAPITARIMADMILDGRTCPLAAAFSPARFAPATA